VAHGDGAGLIQEVYARDLEVNGARGRLILYQGVMLKVELESGGRLHSADGGATT
jgi:hypothetical protein